jgi:hypothetical protein
MGLADDEFVRAVREFLPVIDTNVVALAVAADTLRRLCTRREDLFSLSLLILNSPFELRIFDTGEIIVDDVPVEFIKR